MKINQKPPVRRRVSKVLMDLDNLHHRKTFGADAALGVRMKSVSMDKTYLFIGYFKIA